MAFYSPEKYIIPINDINLEMSKLVGELDEREARLTLIKFLYQNIGLTTYLLTGISLYPDQIIIVKAMLKRNFSLNVMSRGIGKSFVAALYCILQCIFSPNTTIILVSATFRTSRLIFDSIEQMINRKEAKMLFDAAGGKENIKRRPDECKILIGTSKIIALPLSGEKIRGYRANVLLIDELTLMQEEMVEKVLMPYLVAPQDIGERKQIRDRENELVKKGIIKEEDRIIFKNKAKFIGLSSASFTVEYLHKKYQEYLHEIYSDSMPEQGSTYFVSQMAWDSVNPDRIDKGIIEAAQSNEANSANFKKEYGALFQDGSNGYFSIEKMTACTVPDGEEPTLLLRGHKDKQYILAIDPNASNSDTADFFAMCVIELDEDGKGGTIVHSYAQAGEDLKVHIKYFYYLVAYFNVVLIVIDHAGYQFIEAANENELFTKANIEYKIFEFNSEKDGADYDEEIKKVRRLYNREAKRIVFTQYFTSDWLRKSNELLQFNIDYKKIWFGGSINGSASAHNRAISANVNFSLIDFNNKEKSFGDSKDQQKLNLSDFIDNQEFLIKQTKYQCASIEVKTTAKGVQSFDLPQSYKRDKSPTRFRKDNYTCALLGNWAIKCLYDIRNAPVETAEVFTPFFAA